MPCLMFSLKLFFYMLIPNVAKKLGQECVYHCVYITVHLSNKVSVWGLQTPIDLVWDLQLPNHLRPSLLYFALCNIPHFQQHNPPISCRTLTFELYAGNSLDGPLLLWWVQFPTTTVSYWLSFISIDAYLHKETLITTQTS